MAYAIPTDEYVEIDGVPLTTAAWTLVDHAELWGSPEVRGGDVIIPGAAGVLPQRRRPTVTRVDLELAIVGDVSWDGAPEPDVRVGLARNVDHLRALTAAPGTPDGTRLAVLHLPAGHTPATRSGRVHVERLRVAGRGRPMAIGQLTVSIPAGALT